jgi:hypothetical protein
MIAAYVQNNWTEAGISQQLDNYCSLSRSPQCEIIDEINAHYLPKVIADIKNNQTYLQICTEFNLCGNSIGK